MSSQNKASARSRRDASVAAGAPGAAAAVAVREDQTPSPIESHAPSVALLPDAASRTNDLQLAVIGNCEVAVLIDSKARMVWGCLPRLDGDPVFCSLLRAEGGEAAEGVFAVDLHNLASVEQRYLRNTAILESLLHDSQGNVLRIIDYCPRFRFRERFFRPMMFVRMIEPLAGRPIVTIRFKPSSAYGAEEPACCAGSHHLSFASGSLRYRLTTDASLRTLDGSAHVVVDRALAFVIGPDEPVDEAPLGLARRFLDATRTYWEEWVRGLSVPVDWQEEVIRAAITLKLCTYEDTGAVVAALTTSIPEHADSGRNWDYRYCWLRDSYFVIRALNRLGATHTMENYLHFIDQVAATGNGAGIQPLFGIGGDTSLPERVVPGLPGYRSMGPVRVGNLAYVQKQNDVYGAAILACTQLFIDSRLTVPGDWQLFRRLEAFGHRALQVANAPDAGPWEFRGTDAVHTYSSTMSWAGCDRLARIAAWLGLSDRAAFWRRHADDMREEILKRAWNEELKSFSSAFGGFDVDATSLLFPELGLLPATDPRFVATVNAIEHRLKDGDWLYRYRHADDFGRPATAFTVCGFWYVDALAALGRRDEAREQFVRMLQARTKLGLMSEDIDPKSGELWGNFPQTYSLVGIIHSAVRLSRTWDEVL